MYEFMMQLRLSGEESGPVEFVGHDISVEENVIYVDGDSVAALNEDGKWYFGETAYERCSIRVNMPSLPVIAFDTPGIVPYVLNSLHGFVATVRDDVDVESEVSIVGAESTDDPNALRVRDIDPETQVKGEVRVVNASLIMIG